MSCDTTGATAYTFSAVARSPPSVPISGLRKQSQWELGQKDTVVTIVTAFFNPRAAGTKPTCVFALSEVYHRASHPRNFYQGSIGTYSGEERHQDHGFGRYSFKPQSARTTTCPGLPLEVHHGASLGSPQNLREEISEVDRNHRESFIVEFFKPESSKDASMCDFQMLYESTITFYAFFLRIHEQILLKQKHISL